ncbi:MAG: serine dehydratase subunit alpha family protein [Ruminococcaceae bacterium]|nr:serine dehydratase subunit alpha family protein [Oscillospiraceae bacterium]
MEKNIYNTYVRLLERELVPAMGCTEPIAVAYAAATAAKELGVLPEKVDICVSANIIKNVKSVIVPNTGGLYGLAAAAAAGIIAGEPEEELLVISKVSEQQRGQIADYLQKAEFSVRESDSGALFDIFITLSAGGHEAVCRIAGDHTNIVCIRHDGETVYSRNTETDVPDNAEEKALLSVEQIAEFADTLNTADVKRIFDRQISCNMAIAEEGLRGNYGARIGQVILNTRENDVITRAKAYAAAASDARMGGCEKPVVINSGSGNQGITASVPVVIYAKELGVSEDMLYRALAVSNLVTLHLKSGIGPLSAYCGVISAGCGAAAGITYLYGGKFREIAHTIVNALAINSGVICDGAKASCAAKIASAVEAGILGMQMFREGSQFYDGDGIVSKGVENTIRNVSRLAVDGMRKTDSEIIKIMLSK